MKSYFKESLECKTQTVQNYQNDWWKITEIFITLELNLMRIELKRTTLQRNKSKNFTKLKSTLILKKIRSNKLDFEQNLYVWTSLQDQSITRAKSVKSNEISRITIPLFRKSILRNYQSWIDTNCQRRCSILMRRHHHLMRMV